MKTNTSKYLITLFLILLSQAKTFAQLGINSSGTPPANNAMLDVSSTTKGLLIPRMTTAQRNALAHTQGLTVFDITTNGYWYSDGAAWVNIATIANTNQWLTVGNNIINNNTGNVGIGTPIPTDKLSIVNVMPGFGITHTYGNVTMGTYISNLYAQLGTKTNHPLQFFTNNGDAQMTLLPNGNLGVGSVLPTDRLDVVGDVLSEGYLAGFRFNDRADNLKGYQWYSTRGDAHLYRLQAPAGNAISVLENGNIGFNTKPQTDLHINPAGAGSILIGTNRSAGGYTNLEMGISAQSNGQSYIQSTKASGTSWGTLQLNPSGGDVTVAASYMGIGTNTPFYPLDIFQPLNGLETAIRIYTPGNSWGMGNEENAGYLIFSHNGHYRADINKDDGSYTTFSDKRLKKNIEEMSPVLDKVLQLKAKKYQFIDVEDTTKKSTGFISQEVIDLFPELVTSAKHTANDPTLYLGLNYAGFSVIAIKAIQEQQIIIGNQQKTIDYLIREIEKLKALVAIIQKK